MGNPLLAFWHLFAGSEENRRPRDEKDAVTEHRPGHGSPLAPEPVHAPAVPVHTGAIFLILRRMRAPLILLVVVLSVSVVGLTIIPGEQPDGGNRPLSFLHALYVVTYTATTIGYGEIPYPFTDPQRLWVMFTIYGMVIGWAYAIGTMLSLIQDRNFRREVAVQRFMRRVRHMPEPFYILLGYGEAGRRVAHELDRRGRRLVVVDRSPDKIEDLELATLHRDVPAISANIRVNSTLMLAGLEHRRCLGVLALTDDDEANLSVVQAAHLLRPELRVVARASTMAVAERMRAFGDPTVVDPFDAFGDRLRVILRTPALSQLFDWLVSAGGEPPPPRPRPPAHGQWVFVGPRRSSDEVAADLTTADIPVVHVDTGGPPADNPGPEDPRFAELIAASVGLVVVAERETLNVSYIHAARQANPGIFVVSRQESAVDAPIFRALNPDMMLVPSAVVAREVLERMANPALWDFLSAARDQGDAWAAAALDAIIERCGLGSPDVWQVRIGQGKTPALARRILADRARGRFVRIGDLMASPFARGERLPLAVLMLNRGDTHVRMPFDEVRLNVGDVLLLAGGPGARRGWDAMVDQDEVLDFTLAGGSPAAWWNPASRVRARKH